MEEFTRDDLKKLVVESNSKLSIIDSIQPHLKTTLDISDKRIDSLLLEDEQEEDLLGSIKLNFMRCEFGGDFQIQSGSYYGLYFNACSFEHMYIKGGVYHSNVVFRRCTFSAICTIEGGDFDGSLCFDTCKFNEFWLDGKVKLGYELNIYSDNSTSTISRLSIGCKEVSNLKVSSQIIKELEFSGELNHSQVYLRDIEVGSIVFDSFINYASITFFNITGQTHSNLIGMYDSYLGDIHFNNCDFSQFEAIDYTSSTLYTITPNGVSWPPAFKTSDDDIEAREMFRQLKIASQKQGDKIDELYFYSDEMTSYWHSLSITKNFWDWLNLAVSKLTNNFGLNWIRPIVVLIITNVILFPMYLWFSGICTHVHISEIFVFMLPTHSTNFITGHDEMTFGSQLIDYLGRVLNAFLLFQTVSAFRKFYKR